MHWQYTPYTLPLVLAAGVSIAVAILSARRRSAPGVDSAIALMVAVAVWSLSYALELASADLPGKLLWARMEYLGVVATPIAWLAFALRYTGHERWLTPRRLALLSLCAAAGVILVWTNDLHHLIWTHVALDTAGAYTLLIVTHGPGFAGLLFLAYIAVLFGLILLFQDLTRRPHPYRGQAAVVLIAVLVPWLANILYIAGLSPLPNLDPTPLAFTLTGLAVMWGLLRFRLLDIVPIARDTVLDSMGDAVIVLDPDDRVVDANAAARQLLGLQAAAGIGRPADEVLAALPALASWWTAGAVAPLEIAVAHGETRRVLDANCSVLRARRGRPIGRLLLVRDITARRQAEQAIRDSEQKYRTLVQASTDAIFLETLDGRVLDCNPAACELLGYAKEELLALTVADLVPEDVARTIPEVISAELASGGALIETVNKRRDGRVIPVEVSTRLVTLGEEPRVIVWVRDLTGRRQLEQQSRERRLHLESVLACAPDAIVTLDAAQRIVDWNRGAEELFGFGRAEAIGRDLDELVSGGDRDTLDLARDLTAQVLAGRPVPPTETVRYRAGGEPVDVILAGAPILVGGAPAGLVAIYTDARARKWSEQAVRASEEKYRTLVERSLQGIVIAQGIPPRFIFANAAAAGIVGYTVEELLALSPEAVRALVHPGDQAVFFRRYQERLAGKPGVSPYEVRLVRRDGTARHVEIFAGRVEAHGEPAVQATFVDVTERARAELELRAGEERYRSLYQQLALLNRVIAASAAGHEIGPILQTVCREMAGAFDCPHAGAALLNRDRTEIVVVADHHPPDRVSVLGQTVGVADLELVRDACRDKRPVVVDDARSDPRLGRARALIPPAGPLALLILPILIEGEVMGGLGLVAEGPRSFTSGEIDLASRVAEQMSGALARARLAATERRLSTAVDQAGEAVIITGAQDVIQYVNPAFERMTGLTPAEVIGRPPSALLSQELGRLVSWQGEQVAGDGGARQERLEFRRRDGRVCHLDLTVAPVRDPAGETVSYVTTMRDVTRETLLEAEFRQAQKLEALGRLAGGVAHDFNNLLAVVRLSAQLLQRKLRPADPLYEHVPPILEAVERAARLTGQLLKFSRREIIRPHVLDLNQVVADLSQMLPRIIGEDVRLVTAMSDDLWPVQADPTQIEQVIVNLAANARDAMPDGGTLSLETANVTIDAAYAAQHVDARPGEYVRLTASDTGVGMDDAVKTRIFEPFFTTKQPGEGSGLGLATVFGIVTQNGGRMEVDSEVGRGSTFRVYLPRFREAGRAAGERPPGGPPPAARAAQATETVLLAEDDARVRALAVQVLEECGYRVLAAADGLEALRLADQYQGAIHLLLTDMVMPHMSGRELAGRLARARPATRTLFMSGYAGGAVAQHGELGPGAFFLPKPFSVEDLTRMVREALDAPARANDLG